MFTTLYDEQIHSYTHLPPVDLRAVCFVRACIDVPREGERSKTGLVIKKLHSFGKRQTVKQDVYAYVGTTSGIIAHHLNGKKGD